MWRVFCVLFLTSSVFGKYKCPDKCRCPFNDDLLTEVDCNNASLTELPSVVLPETRAIDLSFNNITVLRGTKVYFLNWQKLDMLFLRGNGLTTIESYAFSTLPQLNTLLLDDNHLTKIPADIFGNNSPLMNLSLNGNANLELPDTGFTLPNLETLSMERCGLTKIPPKIFQNMTRLHLVFLQGNELSSFDPQLVSPLTQLSQLDLRHNLFTSLPLDLVRWMPQTLRLRLEGNPFKCACAMADVYSLYQSRHYHEQLSCLDPSNTSFQEFFTSSCNQTHQPSSAPVTAWHPWWFVGAVLAVLILNAIACLVIKWRGLASGYTVRRTFRVLYNDE